MLLVTSIWKTGIIVDGSVYVCGVDVEAMVDGGGFNKTVICCFEVFML